MSQLLDLLQGTSYFNSSRFYSFRSYSITPYQHKSLYSGTYGALVKSRGTKLLLRGTSDVIDRSEIYPIPDKANFCDGAKSDLLPHVRTLRDFPKDELLWKVVMVRFDSSVLLGKKQTSSIITALSTIKYLYEAGAKVVLVSSWTTKTNTELHSLESVAAHLSSILQLRVAVVEYFPGEMQRKWADNDRSSIYLLENLSQFKQDNANCSKFAEVISTGVDIFVNDDFFQSHKVLASTVGVTSFVYASLAGFYFEEGLCQLKNAFRTNGKHYIAIIGGGNLSYKADALQYLSSSCDGLLFVGDMAFQIMHAQGLHVPRKLVERGALKAAHKLIQIAESRRIPIVFPKDFWCMNEHLQKQLELFPANGILNGWSPVALGPKSLKDITSLLVKCEKILWIGPVKFSSLKQDSCGASILVQTLDKLCLNGGDITVVGNMASQAVKEESCSAPVYKMIENASVVWEFLKGRKLPGLMALDRGYPFKVDWNACYNDSAQPLLVDVGSGNGLFLFRMANRRKDLNFLGLEMNGKLVERCIDSVRQSTMKNVHFIATNVTSTFQSIVSSYPGEVVLVAIQCPNPDFSNPEHRWRMLQRSLVEAIVDLLSSSGKVFLQSDIEAVAVRMKEQFMQYGKGKLAIIHDEEEEPTDSQGGWLKENPFGVQSDWEQHVLSRGAPMYRLVLSKTK